MVKAGKVLGVRHVDFKFWLWMKSPVLAVGIRTESVALCWRQGKE